MSKRKQLAAQRVMKDYQEPGHPSLNALCKKHGISTASFYKWKATAKALKPTTAAATISPKANRTEETIIPAVNATPIFNFPPAAFLVMPLAAQQVSAITTIINGSGAKV